MSVKKNKLVYGWGINDVDYNVCRTQAVNGKRKNVWVCPYYAKWVKIIQRGLCPKFQEKYPTYEGCTVSEDWRNLSDFIEWVDSQPNRDWINCEPDKDFLSVGNKHYSPNTVVFVSKKVNGFIIDSGKSRGDYMIGVSYEHKSKKNPYQARCRNPFGGSSHIGLFPTELEAHKAWQTRKHEIACMLADLQPDERVASRLREMYAPDKDWSNR